MTENAQSPAKSNKSPVVGGSLIALAIIASLAIFEGDVHKPYKDQVGVWTVCKGITGKDVIPGKTYTNDECKVLETAYVNKMLDTMGKCVTVPLNPEEWVAYGHFTYNIGTSGFCNSKLVKILNTGNHEQACRQMGKWTFIRINGKLVNCRDPKNKCGGLPKRRDFEVTSCLNAIQ